MFERVPDGLVRAVAVRIKVVSEDPTEQHWILQV